MRSSKQLCVLTIYDPKRGYRVDDIEYAANIVWTTNGQLPKLPSGMAAILAMWRPERILEFATTKKLRPRASPIPEEHMIPNVM
ncbi:hypothetical protein ACTXT7_009361 [Hymenolepis weldensis]